LRRQPAARLASGFTLLELLVVMVIIGIIAGMAVVSIKVLGTDHQMDQEAARLQAILTQARDDAMLTGTDVGLRIDRKGYDFLSYETRSGLWQVVSDDQLLRARTLPEGLNAGLRLEGRDIELKMRSAATAADPIAPQIVVQASGDLAPFDIIFTRDGTTESRRLNGSVNGKFEIHDDAREHP